MIDEIVVSLPNFPKEVLDIWILPLANRAGWPPTEKNDWRYILGKTRSLETLQRMRWKQVTAVPIDPKQIEKRDLEIVSDLFRSHVLKQATIYTACMSDGLARFERCCEYLRNNGKYPKPVILEQSAGGLFHILDGYHRMSAFFYLYGYFKVEDPEVPCLRVSSEQDYWIGSL